MNRWLFKLGSRPCHRSYLWVGILVLGGVQANVGEVRAADLTSPETLPGADLVVQTPATPAAVRRAYTLLNQGLVNDAIAAFRQALQRTPQSLDGKLGLAIAYQRAGRDPEAWTAYQQVLTQDPSNRAALKAVGLLGGYRPEWQTQGIEALNTLLDLTPDDTESRAQRALLLGYQGRFSESLADYERVLQRSPAPDVVLGAAQIYSYSGDYTRSLELFGRYQATGKSLPRDAVTAYTLALRETGNQAQAVQVLEQALVRSPQLDATTIQTRADLAQAYQANQQLTEALTVLEPLRGRADATLPLARALSTLGRREGRSDLYREAIPLYRQALANTPQPSFALTREVADVFSEVPSEREAALALYQQLVSLEPNDRSLLVKQLIVERQLGYLSQAELRQRLSSVLQPLPSESAVQRAIAQALLLLDPPDPELLNVYQDLLAAGVDVPFLNYRVAQIRLAQNDLAGARQALMAYSQTAVGTTDLASTLLLAEIEERSGDLEASAERYKVLLARNPAASLAYSALRGFAEIRLAQNRGAEAIALYDQWLAQNADDQVAQLGRARVAYQAERISQTEAEAVLAQWLQTQSASVTPVELFDLVGALPPTPARAALYDRLLAVAPNNIPVQLRRLQVLAQQSPDEAKAQVAQLVAKNPDNLSAYFLQGEIAQGVGDLTLATQAYQAILEREPENTGALLALAGVRFAQQDFMAATELYQRILALNPENQIARRSLAELSVVQDQPFSALDQFQALDEQQRANNAPDPELANRIQRLQVDILKRRGFQPRWERY